MTKCTRNQKGITLIALIVTIVVLLILAGVSLNIVLGDKGIIKQAQTSKNEYEDKVKDTQEDIDGLYNELIGEREEGVGIKVTTIKLEPTATTLIIGDILNLTDGLTIEPENATNNRVIWRSSNPEVAKVNSGTVTALTEGNAIITVTSTDGSNVSATCTVTVKEKYIVDGVTIPGGYYYVGGTKDSGIVISDEFADKDRYKDQTNVGKDLVGNQWVWVPVEKPSSMYVTASNPIAITGGSTNVISGVATSKYTASEIISGKARVLPNYTSYSVNGKYREPDVIVGDNGKQDDAVESNWKTAGFSSLKNMAETLVKDYDNMIKSLETYKGFYIGRYELTADGEKPGASLTNTNWYNLYAKCKTLAKNNKVSTRMIYGLQWDATCKWLESKEYNITDSSTWGNYSNNTEAGHGQKQDTGFSEKWKANNIYDFAGNCWEWTQEAYYTSYRAFRGGSYNVASSSNPATYRSYYNPDNSGSSNISSRATLFMK